MGGVPCGEELEANLVGLSGFAVAKMFVVRSGEQEGTRRLNYMSHNDYACKVSEGSDSALSEGCFAFTHALITMIVYVYFSFL